MLRLLDGSRAYLHAVIDNFSRRILAWKVYATIDEWRNRLIEEGFDERFEHVDIGGSEHSNLFLACESWLHHEHCESAAEIQASPHALKAMPSTVSRRPLRSGGSGLPALHRRSGLNLPVFFA